MIDITTSKVAVPASLFLALRHRLAHRGQDGGVRRRQDVSTRGHVPRTRVHGRVPHRRVLPRFAFDEGRPSRDDGALHRFESGCAGDLAAEVEGGIARTRRDSRGRLRGGLRATSQAISSILLGKRRMRYLVIGPASMGVFSQIGILEKLNDRIADVEEISGSSAGAIIGFMLALGMSSEEIASAAFDLDMGNFTVPQFRTFLQRYGFVNTQPIRDQFAKIVGCDPTFAQLDKKLYVAAFCLNDAQTVYFSRDTHPDMKVIDAVIMSMSIPVVFATSMYDGKTYVDGSTTEFHPVAHMINARQTSPSSA